MTTIQSLPQLAIPANQSFAPLNLATLPKETNQGVMAPRPQLLSSDLMVLGQSYPGDATTRPTGSALDNFDLDIVLDFDFSGIYSNGGMPATDADVETVAQEVHGAPAMLEESIIKFTKVEPKIWNTANIGAFVQAVLRESYMLQSEQLLDFANKVKHFNNERKAIREELEAVRSHLSQYPGSEDSAAIEAFQTRHIRQDYTGTANSQSSAQDETVLQSAADTGSDRNPFVTLAQQVALANSSTETKQVSLSAAKVAGIASGQGSDDTQAVDDAFDDSTKSLFRHYDNLSPDEKRAFIQVLETKGITQSTFLEEIDGGPNDKHDSTNLEYHFVKDSDESLDQFMTRVNERMVRESKNWIEAADNGDSEVGRIRATILIPGQESVEIPKYSQEELAELYPTLVTQEPSSTSETSETSETSKTSASQSSFTRGDVADNYGELSTYQKNLEDELNSVGEDAQMANLDLQNALQKQQQLLQMMSNISKMLHETAMSIIRKIGS